jgi:hypothetical protein
MIRIVTAAPHLRRLRPSGAVAFALALAAAPAHAVPPSAEESTIKAQFFERFTRFIDWPAHVLHAKTPFVVCLAGANAISAEIERRMTRALVKGQPTRVRRLDPPTTADPGGCHALYVVPALRPQLSVLMARTRGRPILTVADSHGFGELGVLINMYIQDRYIRFEINTVALRDSGLRVSSQLLRLARLLEPPSD